MPRQWRYTTLQPDERPNTEAAAREFIDEVRLRWGIYDKHDEIAWQNVPEKLRKQNEVLRERTRENAAGHTQLAASGLYTSRFRFIHEVIQNADDAYYGTNVPHLTATLYHDKITFESNEQGFTAKDVAALCDIGQSSKSGDDTTTGEKGLGFKSVFGVANLVHIESGHWSFAFVHNEGDDGIGMVVPEWKASQSSSQTPVEGTRLSLHYTTPTDNFRTKLLSVVQNISQDFIFALKRLRKLTINFANAQRGLTSKTFELTSDAEDGCITIRSSTKDESSTTRFLTYKTTLTTMPKNNLRPHSSTEVMLAFQVNENNEPEFPPLGNFIYATLPIRRMPNLRFLVHADFTLLPNRENLNDSAWNQQIISDIPSMFVEALSLFQEKYEALEYTWLDYLPHALVGEEDCWSNLRQEIFNTLSQTESIRSRQTSALKRPQDVRLLPEIFHDDEGDPILDDLPGEDIYLSSEYDQKHFKLLKELGVKDLSPEEMYSRIEAETQSDTSALKATPLRDSWHMSFLNLVDEIGTNDHLKKKVCGLRIIPLWNDEWVAPSTGGTIYLPYVELDDGEKVELPANLRLRKLHPKACTTDDPDFERLYCSLGVAKASSQDVVSRIKKVHQSFENKSSATGEWRQPSTAQDWIQHYEILFWQGFAASDKAGVVLRGVSDANTLVRAPQLYFRSDAPYHTFRLLKDAKGEDSIANQGYGFIYEKYNESKMQNIIRNKYTWPEWLEKVAGFQYYPPLVKETYLKTGTNYNLHPQMQYVAMHRPGDFIHTLQAHWHTYRKYTGPTYKDVIAQISEVIVPCQNGKSDNLRHCILPTQAIMTLSKAYSVEKSLNLLALSTDISQSDNESWTFLQFFGVNSLVDKQLYVDILVALQGKDISENLLQHCKEIYGRLLKCCSLEDKDWLLEQLEEIGGILVPGDDVLFVGPQWVSPSECVWEAPAPLRRKVPLRARYGVLDIAQRFFQGLLGLPNATASDIILDLAEHSDMSDPVNVEKGVFGGLYEALFAFTSEIDELKKIKASFHKDALIYLSGNWYKASDCIWSGHVSTLKALDRQYPDLRSFFVDKIGIRVLSCRVVLAELTKACDEGTHDAGHFKDLLITLGQTMSMDKDSEEVRESGRRLKNSKFLPIYGSSNNLVDMTDEFYILDNESLGNAFKEHVAVLDFSLDELSIIEPIFRSLELSGRYLSKNVKTQVRAINPRLDAKLSDHFRYRAYALSRCAVGHRSHKFLQQNKNTYNLILRCNMYTCKDLETSLVVQQNGKDISILSNRPAIGWEVKNDLLIMNAPHDTEDLVSTVRTDLPKQLMQLLGIRNSEAERQIYRILTEDDEKLADVLEQEDLPEVSWLPPPQPRQQEVTILSSGAADQLQRAISVRAGSWQQSGSWSSSGPPRTNLFRGVLEDNSYETFLSQTVIPQASMSSQVPAQAPNAGSLSDIGTFRLGAAGELFVFERLKALQLPQFGPDNWKSGIRTLVNVVQEYNLSAQNDTEVADIEYVDISGKFQHFLEEHSHNRFPQWSDLSGLGSSFERLSLRDRSPLSFGSDDEEEEDQETANNARHLAAGEEEPIKFLIEVKATPGPCETPFIVSRNQYSHMENHRVRLGIRPSTIYVIFRVYSLFSTNIQYKIYVNPWGLRDRMLRFSTDHWDVVGPLCDRDDRT